MTLSIRPYSRVNRTKVFCILTFPDILMGSSVSDSLTGILRSIIRSLKCRSYKENVRVRGANKWIFLNQLSGNSTRDHFLCNKN